MLRVENDFNKKCLGSPEGGLDPFRRSLRSGGFSFHCFVVSTIYVVFVRNSEVCVIAESKQGESYLCLVLRTVNLPRLKLILCAS